VLPSHLRHHPPTHTKQQVSELSHKLGSAQGSAKSLEAEVAQLRSQAQQLSGEKHSTEMQLSDARAKLLVLQEKVGCAVLCAAATQSPGRDSFGGGGLAAVTRPACS
jgi:predicted  nucleic acid-binding Zn-ribbon protein